MYLKPHALTTLHLQYPQFVNGAILNNGNIVKVYQVETLYLRKRLSLKSKKTANRMVLPLQYLFSRFFASIQTTVHKRPHAWMAAAFEQAPASSPNIA